MEGFYLLSWMADSQERQEACEDREGKGDKRPLLDFVSQLHGLQFRSQGH